MTIIKIRDFRTCGICPQARTQFFERHDLDWRDFVRNGIAVEVLRASGDQPDKINQLEQAALKRESRDG